MLTIAWMSDSSGVAGVLPRRAQVSDRLERCGLVSSRPEVLQAMGFERAYTCDTRCTPSDLAVDAARAALSDAGVQPREIDVLVWASARPESHVTAGMTANTTHATRCYRDSPTRQRGCRTRSISRTTPR